MAPDWNEAFQRRYEQRLSWKSRQQQLDDEMAAVRKNWTTEDTVLLKRLRRLFPDWPEPGLSRMLDRFMFREVFTDGWVTIMVRTMHYKEFGFDQAPFNTKVWSSFSDIVRDLSDLSDLCNGKFLITWDVKLVEVAYNQKVGRLFVTIKLVVDGLTIFTDEEQRVRGLVDL